MNHELKGTTQYLLSVTDPLQVEHWLGEHGSCPSLAMVGRSNVGKSSLINMLFGQKTARTSKAPGRTRAINIFQFELNSQIRYLYDLPGYGYAKAPRAIQQEWGLLMESFFRLLTAATLLVNIQDIRHPNQPADIEFGDYIKGHSSPLWLVFNKVDKLRTQKERRVLESTPQGVFYLSAKSGQGVQTLENALLEKFSV